MQVFETIAEMRRFSNEQRAKNRQLGFVPTMGALHEGHLSLIDRARELAATVVVSLFVNPTQFNNLSDLEKYPRTLKNDLDLVQERGVGAVFVPSVAEMFPCGQEQYRAGGSACRVIAGSRSRGLCGETRPGHFDGVVTVVLQLLGIVQPTVAVFGEKDFQQLHVIKQMVRDLHVPVEIAHGPLVRDIDGLALSSRNARLSTEQRYHALSISKSLFLTQKLVREGQRDTEKLRKVTLDNVTLSGGLKIDYLDFVDADSMEPAGKEITRPTQLCVAAFAGDVRLIDNVRLEP